MRKTIFCLILTIAQVCLLKGQGFSFINYSIDDGLPSSQVYQVMKDQNGYIWFTSDAGIGKMEMGKIKVFTMADSLPDNTVFTLNQTNRNTLIGTCYNSNLFEIGIETGKVNKIYKQMAKTLEKDKALIFQTTLLNNTFLLNTDKGLYNYNAQNEAISKFKLEKDVDIFIIVKNNKAALNCNNENLLKSKFRVKLSIDNKVCYYNLIFDVVNFKEGSNNLRVNTLANGSVGISLSNKYYILNRDGSSSVNNMKEEILSVYQDLDKDLWIGVRNYGVYYYKKSNLQRKPENLLKNSSVTSICNDNEHGIWISTLEKGIFYTPSKLFKQVDSDKLSTIKTIKIELNKDRIFLLASENKLYTLKRDSSKHLEIVDKTSFVKGEIYNLKYFKSNLFVIGRSLSFILSDKVLSKKISVPNKNGYRSVCVDSNNSFWVSSYAGVLCYSSDSMILGSHTFAINLNSYGLALTTNNEVIIGSFKGLYKFSNSKLSPLFENKPLLKNRIDYVFVDSFNRYWLMINGFGLGILYNNKLYLIKQSGPDINSKVTSIVQDGLNYWIGTKRGLFKLNLEYNGDTIVNHQTVSYTKEDGLNSDEINTLQLFEEYLLIGTSKGFCYANHSQLTKKYPSAAIQLKVRDNLFTTSSNGKLSIDYDFNDLLINIKQAAYRNFKNTKFAYKFETDSTFTVENSSTISLKNLKYGNYKLIVKNSDQADYSPIATLNFIVKKPLWLRWWFISLVLCFLIGFIYLIFLIRTKKTKRLNLEKMRVERLINEYRLNALQSQMNPHFIFNAFSSIQQFILTNHIDEAYDYLAKFSKLIRLVLESSQNKYISLQNELDLLQLYLEVEQLRTDYKFKFKIDINSDINIDSVSIPIMLIQPHVENAIWHGISHLKGKNGLIVIEVNENEKYILFTVTDNGVGRAEAVKYNSPHFKKHKSLSTTITNERLNLFESAIEIIDLIDTNTNAIGTKVIIKIRKNDD